MPSGNALVNSSACFQPVSQLSILNIVPSAEILSEEMLRQKAAKEADRCEDPLVRLQLKCLAIGFATGKKLVRHFLSKNATTMDCARFVQTLRSFPSLSLSESEAKEIFDRLSVRLGTSSAAAGVLSVAKMVEEFTPPLKAQRRELVEEVFRKMDPNDTGSVPLSALYARFDHRRQPQFESGKKSREELLASFLDTFEPDPDGQVLAIEFLAFYAAKSAAVQNDIHFDWMLRSQWKL
ncbi:hypothetical protein niasHT_030800 [Heterodera trifolii]|uniref:Calmodulin n=1 Tax=Heterodera trifolii TaxID=157864 RepID=A0ABD2HNE1_9BILA